MKLSPGLICIPTTSGTGSEVSDGMVLSDENHVKYPILATNAMSDYAIIDPELRVGMPPGLTAATGLDTLCHFVEGFQSNAASTLTDFFNKKGIETVIKYLPRAVADGTDIEARSEMAVASVVGGWMLGTSHTNAGHSFGHTVGGHFNIPHGVACAAGEPYVIEGNAEVIPEKTSVGVIRKDEEEGVIVLAKPMGVLGCVTPTTNPTITPLVNGMCAVKCANSLVVSPHPRAKNTTMLTVKYMNEAIIAAGGPADLVQCIDKPDVDVSGLLMKKVDVILATGGPDMVKAAYSSGKPAFGVGAGNSQSIIDRGIDFEQAAADIIDGRTFDLGVICAGNQCIIVHEDDYETMKAACIKAGAYWADDAEEAGKLRDTLFINGSLNKAVIGQVPATIGKMAGVTIPEDRAAVMIRATGTDDVLCKEKLTTAIAILTYKNFDDAVEYACTNLFREGAGHSAVLYSNDDDKILAAAKKLPVGRILVNQPGHAAGGDSRFNGLEGTVSLGCGSWGRNSISENLTYHHLYNVSRIAYRHPMPGCDATPEEIFAD
jgi:succinate-semialdehyde dehydrogenase